VLLSFPPAPLPAPTWCYSKNVLSLRLVIFAGLSGIALWGLFSLLDTLREPQLLRTAKSVLVKGCEPIESEDAIRLCPQLFCQKFLLDGRVLPPRTVFKITVDAKTGNQQLIGGLAGTGDQHFACVLRDNKVLAGRVLDAGRLDALSAQPAGWSLD
jgi:hypothetical protein